MFKMVSAYITAPVIVHWNL